MQNTDNVGSVDACLAGLRSYTDDVNRTQAGAVSTVAKRYGVHFMAYEGGPHLCQENNVEIKAAANRDPRMGDLVYHDLKENWFAQGGELYAYFNLCSGYNKYGYWGLTETLNDLTSPKYQAILDLADELEPTESGVAVRHPAVRTIVKPAANAPVRTSERFLPTGRRLHAPGSGPVHPVADGLYLDGHGGTCLVR